MVSLLFLDDKEKQLNIRIVACNCSLHEKLVKPSVAYQNNLQLLLLHKCPMKSALILILKPVSRYHWCLHFVLEVNDLVIMSE